MPIPIILATANQDKVREFRQILPARFQVITMREAGFHGSIEENGTSFAENALIKARAVHRITGGLVLADDSGLSVDVLDGAPGLYSARFAGEGADYKTKIGLLHHWLEPWPPSQWQASFICAIALIRPDGEEQTVTGICRGSIAQVPRGSNGFGYDPVFLLPDGSRTMAELPDDEKNSISHRGLALRQIAAILDKLA